MIRRYVLFLFCLLVGAGCGSSGGSDSVFVATGGSAAGAADSGRVVFNFTRAQTLSVPTGTVQLDFQFFNNGGVVLLAERRDYADQIVFENVPGEVTSVEVTAFDANGLPILFATGAVEVSSLEDFVVALSSEAVTLDEVVVSPDMVTLEASQTQQLSLLGRFSNGSVANLDPALATYSGFDTNIVTVSDSGLLTGVGFGTTTVVVGFEVSGVVTESEPVTVTGPIGPISLSQAVNTFDTDTGELNGTVADGWDGTVLNSADFTLDGAATLTVTGSQPFQVASTGNVSIAGIIDASGGDGEDGLCGSPGGGVVRLGGVAGPGGFAGGNGGSTAAGSIDGLDGEGPGAGGGGSVEGSGGGAGHLNAGTAGGETNGGAGGPAYTSIPTTLIGGSGGGGGNGQDDGVVGPDPSDDDGAGGGGGGGAVRITAVGTLTVDGTIDCSGGNGGGGECSNSSHDGGAGSGGSIELLATGLPVVNGTLNVDPGTPGNGESGGGTASEGRTRVETL